ncbi:unnamed protein product [Cladocopium goreaui]|uniref:Uncharacterized protein n=1 Tax=Cladocopium goreaui TaxID=2562237 RepID=A0A9P1FZV6_9DINO|nr:unnamed protein product [Cladocopium goreaui]
MWARKVGVPPKWASRVKVVALSVFTASIGIAMFNFMMNLSIGQLDLAKPRHEGDDKVYCFMATGYRCDSDEKMQHFLVRLEHKHRRPFPDVLECEVQDVQNTSCSRVHVPVASINGHMIPMAGRIDWLRWWAKLFLVLSLLLLLGISTHDLALLSVLKQEEIMDFRSLRWQFPILRRAFSLLMGLAVCQRILRRRGLGRCAKILSRLGIPFLIVWNLGLAVLVLSPVCVALFLMHPIRLSRAAVFVQSLVCAVYSLAFFIQFMVWSLHRHWRPWYALTWLVRGTVATEHPLAEKVDCLCGCEYSVSNHALFQLIVISITGLVKSLTVAFRCIKGLRRSEWANLISVLFSVPINVYPVTWASLPDAQWPEMCHEDSETQGERAFDPFVLMDEQLNSKSLRLQLAAVQTSCGSPRAGDLTPREADMIGCCGFPYARKRVDMADSSPETPMID